MKILELWPEIEWIENDKLRDSVARTWELALKRSVLTADDLNNIPFTLLC